MSPEKMPAPLAGPLLAATTAAQKNASIGDSASAAGRRIAVEMDLFECDIGRGIDEHGAPSTQSATAAGIARTSIAAVGQAVLDCDIADCHLAVLDKERPILVLAVDGRAAAVDNQLGVGVQFNAGHEAADGNRPKTGVNRDRMRAGPGGVDGWRS